FTYHAISNFVNGVYTGTTVALTFDPMSRQRADRITYSAQLRDADAEVDNLRDQISRIIAGRMLQRLQQGQPVRWTSNLCYLPDGLEYRPSGWVGRKEAQVLPYDQIGGHNLDQGIFYLWAKGIQKPIM